MVVIMFAGIPFIPVDLATIKFDTARSAQCQVNVPLPNDTGWCNVYTALNDQSALVPVWWFFMHALSKAVTGSAVAAIPCGTDQIGSASCRERVCQYVSIPVVAVSLKKKRNSSIHESCTMSRCQ